MSGGVGMGAGREDLPTRLLGAWLRWVKRNG